MWIKHLFDQFYYCFGYFPMGGSLKILAVSRTCIRQSEIIAKRTLRFLTTRTMNETSKPKCEEVTLEKAKSELRRMYDAGVQAVLPTTIIENSIHISGNELRVSSKSYYLTGRIYLVGFGKAVMGMAAALEKKLGPRLEKGIVSIPRGSKAQFCEAKHTKLPLPLLNGSIDYRENSVYNQPDSETITSTYEIVKLVENLKENDTLIVLISGGGSALLCMPRSTIQPETKLELCRKLQNSGADIRLVNIVRMKLSMIKGGGLAQMAYPARVISLILSDVIGDPVDIIASGPTSYNQKDPEEVVSILKKFHLYDNLHGDLKNLLTSEESADDNNLVNDRKQFKHVDNFIIGNNTIAIEAASREAVLSSLRPILLRKDVEGRVEKVSEAYARVTGLLCKAWNKSIDIRTFFEAMKNDSVISLPSTKVEEIFHALEEPLGQGIVLIGAGEPTVIVQGSGKGGRNQELALRFSLDWYEIIRNDPQMAEFEVTFLSAGTDGQDGPTDATGAFGYSAIGPMVQAVLKKLQSLCSEENVADASNEDNSTGSKGASKFADKTNSLKTMLREAEKMVPQSVLTNSDSYNFYSRFRWGKDLLKTGISGTNVMDLHFVLIKKRQSGCPIDFDRIENCPDLLKKHDLHSRMDEPVMQSKKNHGHEV